MSGSQPRPDLDAQIAHPRPHRTRGTQMQNARGTGDLAYLDGCAESAIIGDLRYAMAQKGVMEL